MAETAATDGAARSHPPSFRPVVYVVEPNPLMAQLERAVLRPFDVQLVSPQSLLEASLTLPPALIITDILLPGADGLQLCRQIKSCPGTSGIPVLVFSGLKASEEALDAGADSFLPKPAERAVLLGEVTRLVRGDRGGT